MKGGLLKKAALRKLARPWKVVTANAAPPWNVTAENEA